MNILGIGLWEILLILALAFVVLGPQDMGTLGRKAGQVLRQWLNSDEYREIKRTQDVLSSIPKKLMEETGLDEKSISPWSAPEAAAQKTQSIPEPPTENSSPANPQTNPAVEEDPLSAWTNPGGTPAEKRKAMLDSIHRNTAQASPEAPADDSQTDPQPPKPDPVSPTDDL